VESADEAGSKAPSDPEQDGDLLVGRKAAQVLLREDLASVEADLENAASGGLEFDIQLGMQVFQLSGQTDRLGVVVSSGAVFDAQLHLWGSSGEG
jgi:hypothetical protein